MSNKQWDGIWINGLIATSEPGASLLNQAAIATQDGKIAWVGLMQDLPGNPYELACNVYDVSGHCVTAGLVDCHTHLVYAGNRSNEFELRLQGVTYEEIARQGGGIQSTVAATRAVSEDELLQQSLVRAQALLASGVMTVEIKSGYGLDWKTELKMLRVAKSIEEKLPLTVRKTFLGAHTIPVEYRGKTDAYVDLVCHSMIPAVAEEKLADAVDVFCERIAFNINQTERVFETAAKYGLAIKCHSEQLSDSGSAQLAAKYKALSVDHLEYISEEGVRAIAASGTTAVLLPGAFYFLREKIMPPIELLRQYKIPMAIASDCNPGTSPIMSLPVIMNMACTLFRLTPTEALEGTTLNAAKALGLSETCGTLTVGKNADFVVWNVSHPVELAYYLGYAAPVFLVKSGKIVTL